MRWLKQLIAIVTVGIVAALGLFEIFFWFGTPPTLLNRQSDHFISAAGTDIAYSVRGQGPAVMLLHSGAWSSTEFEPLIAELAKQHTVYAVDLPGFGRSAKPQVTYSLDFLTTRLSSFIDQFPEKHFDLVGASVGGSIAVQLAKQFPNRVRSVSLIDPLGFGSTINQPALVTQIPVLGELLFSPNPMTFDYALQHGLTDQADLDAALKEKLFTECSSPKAQRAKLSLLRSLLTVRGINETVQATVQDAALAVEQPTLLIWGEDDSYAPIIQLDKAQELIPQARVARLAHTGHFAQLEAPLEVSKALEDFWKKL